MAEIHSRGTQTRIETYLNNAAEMWASGEFAQFYNIMLLAYREAKPFTKENDLCLLKEIDQLKHECLDAKPSNGIHTFTQSSQIRKMNLPKLEELDSKIQLLCKRNGFISTEKDESLWGIKDD